MSEEPDLDRNKWIRPSTGGELAVGLLQIRQSQHHLIELIMALKTGDNAKFNAAYDKLVEADAELKQIINDVGGLAGRAK